MSRRVYVLLRHGVAGSNASGRLLIRTSTRSQKNPARPIKIMPVIDQIGAGQSPRIHDDRAQPQLHTGHFTHHDQDPRK